MRIVVCHLGTQMLYPLPLHAQQAFLRIKHLAAKSAIGFNSDRALKIDQLLQQHVGIQRNPPGNWGPFWEFQFRQDFHSPLYPASRSCIRSAPPDVGREIHDPPGPGNRQRPSAVSTRSQPFNPAISTAVAQASACSQRAFTNSPMRLRSPVNSTSGTTAKLN